MICSLFGSAILAIRRGSETPFIHGRMKTSNASPHAIELNPRCFEQAYSKGPRTGPRNENMKYGYTFSMLWAPGILHLLSHANA